MSHCWHITVSLLFVAVVAAATAGVSPLEQNAHAKPPVQGGNSDAAHSEFQRAVKVSALGEVQDYSKHSAAAGIGKKHTPLIGSMKVGRGRNAQKPKQSLQTFATVQIDAEGVGSSQYVQPDLMHGLAKVHLDVTAKAALKTVKPAQGEPDSLAEVHTAKRLSTAATKKANTADTEVTSPNIITGIKPKAITANVATKITLEGTVAAGDKVTWATNCSEADPNINPTVGTDETSSFFVGSGKHKLCYRARGASDSVEQEGITLDVQELSAVSGQSLLYVGIGVGVAAVVAMVMAGIIAFGMGGENRS